MSGRYAAETSVPVERSRAEVERILQRYGASSFAYGWEGARSVIQFDHQGRRIRITMTMPDRDDPAFRVTETGQRRSDSAAESAWQRACRQRWRALVLVLKAKLEAVESGIATFDDEFLAYLVLPDGRTLGEWAGPQLAAANGSMPALLPGVR